MDILNMMQSCANVQIVVSLTDLREMFNQWQDERDAMKPAEKEDKLLTADEAANLLNITSVTLWRWAKSGYLKSVKAGRKRHYWKSEIDKLLEKREG
jgi:excisionase family DNA binding protein